MYGKKYTHTECGAEETKRRRKEKKREEKRKTDQKNPQKGITKPKNHRHIVRSYISLILSEQSKVYGLHHSFDLCVTHKKCSYTLFWLLRLMLSHLVSICTQWCPILLHVYIFFLNTHLFIGVSVDSVLFEYFHPKSKNYVPKESEGNEIYDTCTQSHTHTPNNAKKESLDRIKWKVFYVRCGFDFFFVSVSLPFVFYTTLKLRV